MKLGLCLTVRNEKGRATDCVRYHLEHQGVDFIVVVDNGSMDGTWKELNAIKDERLILTRTEWNFGFHQGMIFTQAVKDMIGNLGCDWVFPLDADEFFYSGTHGTIKALLKELPEDLDHVDYHMYHMRETVRDDSSEPFYLKRIRYGRQSSYKKVGISKLGLKKLDSVAQGAHEAYCIKGQSWNTLYLEPDKLVKHHYNHISMQDTIYRVLNQVEGYLVSMGDDWLRGKSELSKHIREMYFDLKNGKFEEEYKKNFVWDEELLTKKLKAGRFMYKPEIARLYGYNG